MDLSKGRFRRQMMERTRTYSYKVAGLTFSVIAPVGIDIEALLPSFKDFRATSGEMSAPEPHREMSASEPHRELLRLILQAEPLEIPSDAKEVETDDNDMGHTRLLRTEDGRYCVELSGSRDGKVLGTFIANASFSSVYASIRTDATAGSILSSMLRIAFAQAVILREGLSIHASAVVSDGKAYLFLGKSGTGKSTHARLWLKNIPGSHLLNDDNPAVRLIDGSPVAFGTPWSGKTPCYRDESAPVGGFVRLRQGDADIFTEKEDVAAFVALLPSCSVIHSDANLQSMLYDTLTRLSERVPVGELTCLPDDESAIVCHKNIKSIIK